MSDIVDSTRRWNAAEGAMAADLELHDRLIRDVVEGAGGSVFKHTGDGMIAVFDDPVAAVGAAASIQRIIGDTAWQHTDGLQVRAAVHSGVVYPRDGDLFGTAVNKLARILGACPPGAVLVSNVVAGLLAERAPEGLGVRAVGEVSLAGFSTPEHLFALTGAGMASIGGLAPTTSTRMGGRLPRIDDELIGRTEEVAAIWEALGRARLVTLVGVGGMGKTRLALEVAAGGVDAFPGGVWWIDLATATTADAVLPVAMAAVEAQESQGRTPLEAFCERFTKVTALVVIDNCEHVLAAAFELVDALRSAAPEVRIVATSREALGVRGEHLQPVGALAVDEGVTLFVERAVAARPDLDASTEQAVIERICTRLDGIPLAIELAAARCRSMTPTEIDARLDDRFRLLRGGRAGAERHRTLQAAVAWSYEMLDDDERHVFHHLAVFAGGTLLDGLAAVCEMDELDALDVVDRLIVRSMVVATTTPLGTRYHQLETLRQYAEDRLIEADTIEQARDQHLAWAHRLAGWIDSTVCTPLGATGFHRFCAEIDNFRIAVAHAVGTGRHHLGHEIVAPLTVPARSRPAYEVFDWVRPIQLDGEWTSAAAICAVRGAVADLRRGIPLPVGVVGGLPDHLLATDPMVQLAQAEVWVLAGQNSRRALELINRIEADDDRTRAAIEWTRLLAYRASDLVESVDDDEFEVCRQRGLAALETTRRQGDDYLVGRFANILAITLAPRFPSQARELATEAIELADRLGAWTIRNSAVSAYFFALAGVPSAAAEVPIVDVVALRAAILHSLESGDERMSMVLSSSAFLLLNNTEQAAALLLRVLWLRASGVDLALQLERAGIPVPDDWSVWEHRAERMSLNDAVRLILAALDRVIAAGGDETAGGGG